MDLKPYIAIFFTVIFFGKFLMLDAKFLEGILESQELAYVNPSCEKDYININELETPQDFLPDSIIQSISIDSFCNAPFHFEIAPWTYAKIQEVFQPYSYTFPGTPQIFRDSFYPPPKVA